MCVCVRVIPAWHHHHLLGTAIMAGISERERGRERTDSVPRHSVAFSCFNVSGRCNETERGKLKFVSSLVSDAFCVSINPQ